MKTNIVLVSLCNEMSKFVSKRLAKKMEMYFLDTEELLKYNLQNEKDIKNLCGEKYLDSLKNKVLSSVFDYDNSLIYLPFALFLENDNAKKLKKNSNIVFLALEKKDYKSLLLGGKEVLSDEKKVEFLAFDIRNEFCKKNCDLCVKLSSTNFEFAFDKAKKCIDDYLL
ncbi:MAG: hypothetical protein EOM55_02205 [Clostridia bacterium]|nr:hypothetical protein [Clostridia bacterium]